VDDLWGEPVRLDFVFFELPEMCRYLEAAGFDVAEVVERGPYPDVEGRRRSVRSGLVADLLGGALLFGGIAYMHPNEKTA
jgi:hypothetical protein